jgi:glycosyltransferase involved in cell wall biosynthesis
MDGRALLRTARRGAVHAGRRLRTEADWLRSRRGRADLAVFHEFAPPPGGGGHQFLRALVRELESRGVAVELNRVSAGTPACLFNSFNFDFDRLRRFVRDDCRMVHRVDGPVGAYRGFDDGTDTRIAEANRSLAAATVVQSRYSLSAHVELGIELRDPVLIRNAVDPGIFHPSPGEGEPLAGRKLRLVASSWSANPRKGTETLSWLDENLDWTRYEMTFVGQSPVRFRRIAMAGPLDSHGVAELLRRQDVYIAASEKDPSSNALLEALACGLPAAFLASGGHPELVGEGGLPFCRADELPDVLERLTAELDERRAAISVPRLSETADRYLEVLGLAPT